MLQPQSTLLEAAAVTAAIYLCRALLPYFPFSLLALLLKQQPLSGLRVEAVADSSNNLGGKRPTVKCSEAAAAAHAIVFLECYAPFPLLFLYCAVHMICHFFKKGGKMDERKVCGKVSNGLFSYIDVFIFRACIARPYILAGSSSTSKL